MKLEDLQVYQLAMQLGDDAWADVAKWDFLSKDTIGKQFIRAADSVAANIAEGYGRYHFKENINFCYYARGSLFETKTFVAKAYQRKLINEVRQQLYLTDIESLQVKLNAYIKSIGRSQ